MADSKKNKQFGNDGAQCTPEKRKLTRELMGMIGDKWSLSVICSLATSEGGRARFSTMERQVEGISQRMLTTTLRNLERDGIIVRQVFPEVPPRVEYELTELGRNLVIPIRQLVEWIALNSEGMLTARAKFDAKHAKAGTAKARA